MSVDLDGWKYNQELAFIEENVPSLVWKAWVDINKLNQELMDDFKSFVDLYIKEVPEELYHYTDASGFQGIFSSYMIRLSDSRFMNDPHEGLCVFREGLVQTQSITQHLFLKGRLLRRLEAIISAPELWDRCQDNEYRDEDVMWAAMGGAFRPAYLMSFSEDGDLLSQWRGYGGEGFGVSIGFDVKNLEFSTYEKDYFKPRPNIIKVVYDVSVQRRKIDFILSKILKLYNLYECEFEHHEGASEFLIGNLVSNLCESLHRFRLIFKDKAYSEEKEWRLVLNPIPFPSNVPTRVSGKLIVPYIEVPVPQVRRDGINEISVKTIFLGPKCPDLFMTSIRYMLQNLAYPKIIRSSVSYR